MVKTYKLGNVSMFPQDKITIVETELETIAVANLNGTLYAYRDSCTHDGTGMGSCHLVGEEVECPRHGARFNVKTGSCTRMPAVSPLQTFPVTLKDNVAFVEIED